MDQQNVSGFPVTSDGTSRGQLRGILTRRDMKFLDDPEETVGAAKGSPRSGGPLSDPRGCWQSR